MTEDQVARPVQLVAGFVVVRRLGPAGQFYFGEALLASFGVLVVRAFLHVAQHLVIVDAGSIGIGDVAVVHIGHHHRPAVLIQQHVRIVAGQDHAQHVLVRRVVPQLAKHALCIARVEEAVARFQREVRMGGWNGYVAAERVQRGEKMFGLAVGGVGGVSGEWQAKQGSQREACRHGIAACHVLSPVAFVPSMRGRGAARAGAPPRRVPAMLYQSRRGTPSRRNPSQNRTAQRGRMCSDSFQCPPATRTTA